MRDTVAKADTDEERVGVWLVDIDTLLLRDAVDDADAIEATLAEPDRDPDTERVIVVEADLDLLILTGILDDGDPVTLAP